jgi:hypothetical protein
VSVVGAASRFSIVAIADRNPMMWRYWASRDNRYWSSLPAMIALAHRAVDCAVKAFLRALSSSRRTCRRSSALNAGSTGSR